ncbi:7-cyano-7-deazaguanine synthase [Aerosakkonemataceae cyanobacterium BLCC-F50]|uniref:7-cyano-7-deazaguanine synthase n=1 Tax=Floridaenema flaviceps BLCC-F50 TaxID=3153642 RepID=A0ABV4XQ12_9CYAN
MKYNLPPEQRYQMHNSDYTLHFDSILNSNGKVRFVDRSSNNESTIGITVDDEDFKFRIWQEFPSVIADLIDLAVAIYATDRLISHPLDKEQICISVVLPVRHPELLNTVSFQNKLESLLEWTTGRRWFFDFQRRTASERIVENQQILRMVPQGCEVALWSGGLDALAGLYTRLQGSDPKPFMLFGTGSNNSVYARQKRVFKAIEPSFPNRLNLCRVPINFSDSNQYQKNKISRARGVVFTMLGAACAYLMGQKELFVYENGIGAINLPYRKSAVGLDHTRSVNPLTLLRVSDIVSELLGEEFRVQNPFLFWTKAQMCKALAEHRRNDLPPLTMSCDSPHRQKPVQCGYCSSCLLRRQALAASNMEDKTRYVVLHGKRPVADPSLYLRNMLAQVSTIRSLFNVSDNPNLRWENLTRRFFELDNIVDQTAGTEKLLPVEMQHRLIQLYETYIAEWDAVESQISVGLLDWENNRNTSDKRLFAVQ